MQTFFDLSPPWYNSPTSVVWLEQPLHKVFKSKAPPERTLFFANNLFWLIRSIILILWVLQKINCWISIWWARVNFDISTFHLLPAHVFSSISETIHVNPLITTIKKNKIVSLLFNVGLNIFTTFHLPYSLSHLYIFVVIFIHFN